MTTTMSVLRILRATGEANYQQGVYKLEYAFTEEQSGRLSTATQGKGTI